VGTNSSRLGETGAGGFGIGYIEFRKHKYCKNVKNYECQEWGSISFWLMGKEREQKKRRPRERQIRLNLKKI